MFGFIDSLHVFYEGISLLHCARCNPNEPQYMEIVEKRALPSFRRWAQHSLWNFENRLFLLEAQWYFAKGEMQQAEEKFKAAIESARKHRFVHEEGLANELCADFYTATGHPDKSKVHLAEARACYKLWGAQAILDRLDGVTID